MTADTQAAAVRPMSKEQREQFERDGYLVIRARSARPRSSSTPGP